MKLSTPVLVNGGLALVIVAAAVGGVLVFAPPASSSSGSNATQLTATVQQGTVSSTVSASGSISPAKEVDADFRVSGTIASVDVALGQTVTAGQQLGTLDTTELQNAVDEAYQSYLHAGQNLTAAQTQPNAQVSQVNAAKDARTKASDAYQSAKAELASATLTAPIAGLVIALNGEVGGTAGGASGSGGSGSSAFVTIADTSSFTVTTNIAEGDIAQVAVGAAATVTFPAITGASADATVTAIAPTATSSNSIVSYPTTVTLASAPDGLRLGQTAEVTITVAASAADALYVPSAAVTTAADGTATVTVIDATTHASSEVTVTTGVVGDEGTEITSGLTAGETVSLGTVSASTNNATTGGTRGGFGGAGFGGGAFTGGGFGGGGFGGNRSEVGK